MAFNGSGTFLINTAGQPVVSGTVISSTAFNALTADLATGLSTAITKDGQTTVTANIPMSTYKFTGLGVGSAATDSANLSQVQSTVTKLLNSVSGADTITATASPTLAAYAAGQMFYFVAAGDNTTSVTLNIDSLGAKAVTRDGSVALAAADIKSGEVIVVVYDGTRFQVVSQLNSAGDARFANVSIASSLYVGGVSTFVGNAGFSANVSIASALSVGGVAAITGATTIGGNLTLSGGTANGVLYLNGSKVATSGSALVFDGSNLLIGQATNAQNYRLVIKGSAGSADDLAFNSDATRSEIQSFNSKPLELNRQGNNVTIGSAGSGNLGIGTASPGRKLEVASSTAALIRITSSAASGTGYAATEFYNGAGFGYCGTESSTAGALFVGSTAYATILGNTTAYPIQFATNNNVRATIDSSGNLGLGVTPSASWRTDTTLAVLEVKSAGSAIWNAGARNFNFSNNSYWVTGGSFQYASTGAAAWYQQTGGEHRFYNAASGTAGNAISFTQAMTLDASGNLFCGGTTGSSRLNLQTATNSSTDSNYITLYNAGENVGHINWINGNGDLARITGTKTGAGASANDGILTFSTATDTVLTERARITSGGELLVGTTATNSGARLDVKGVDSTASNYCVFFENSSSNLLLAVQNDGRWRSGTAAASPYNFVVGATNRDLFVDNAGEIGYVSSVRASKTNIAPVADTNWLLQLNPVTFNFRKRDEDGNYTDEADGPIKHGLIAEEVESVNSDLCFYDDEDKGGALRGVNYSHLITPMLKLIQKQQAAIAALEAKVTALESK